MFLSYVNLNILINEGFEISLEAVKIGTLGPNCRWPNHTNVHIGMLTDLRTCEVILSLT